MGNVTLGIDHSLLLEAFRLETGAAVSENNE
jgi:hypothetical protein